MSFAAHSGDVDESLRLKTLRLFRGLGECSPDNLTVVVGGYWGLMKDVVDVSLSLGLKVLILPPLELEHVNFPEGALVVKTGTSFRVRSVFMVRTSDVLVVLGGGAGCLQELVTAYTEGKPTYVLVKTGLPTDVTEGLPEYLDHRKLAPLKKFDDESELLKDLCEHLRNLKPQQAPSIHG